MVKHWFPKPNLWVQIPFFLVYIVIDRSGEIGIHARFRF